MATYEQMQRRLDVLRNGGEQGGTLSDACGTNPGSWRDQLPVAAPSMAADADYAELEDRLYGLRTDLAELDAAWDELGARLHARATDGASDLAVKLAAGESVSADDVTEVTDIDAATQRDAAALIKQATAARAAIAQIAGQMQAMAAERGEKWRAARERELHKAADAAREAQRAANHAEALAEEAFTRHLWAQKLPGSIGHGVMRGVEDGDWQSDSGELRVDGGALWDNRLVAAALETGAFKRPDYMDADGACYVVNQGGTISQVAPEHFQRIMRSTNPTITARPAVPEEIARYWRRMGWVYNAKNGAKVKRSGDRASQLRVPAADH